MCITLFKPPPHGDAPQALFTGLPPSKKAAKIIESIGAAAEASRTEQGERTAAKRLSEHGAELHVVGDGSYTITTPGRCCKFSDLAGVVGFIASITEDGA
jgi:hypothetical protein